MQILFEELLSVPEFLHGIIKLLLLAAFGFWLSQGQVTTTSRDTFHSIGIKCLKSDRWIGLLVATLSKSCRRPLMATGRKLYKVLRTATLTNVSYIHKVNFEHHASGNGNIFFMRNIG